MTAEQIINFAHNEILLHDGWEYDAAAQSFSKMFDFYTQASLASIYVRADTNYIKLSSECFLGSPRNILINCHYCPFKTVTSESEVRDLVKEYLSAVEKTIGETGSRKLFLKYGRYEPPAADETGRNLMEVL
jgi:hypothetical protein